MKAIKNYSDFGIYFDDQKKVYTIEDREGHRIANREGNSEFSTLKDADEMLDTFYCYHWEVSAGAYAGMDKPKPPFVYEY
jgi:hypothetical protein